MPNHESSVTRCSPRFNLCVSSFDYRLEARSSQRQLKVHVGTPAQRHALELVHTSQSATETSIRVRKTHRCASNSQLDHLLTRREKEQTENEDDKEGPGIRNSPREKVTRSLKFTVLIPCTALRPSSRQGECESHLYFSRSAKE